jgi:hypothetical protein
MEEFLFRRFLKTGSRNALKAFILWRTFLFWRTGIPWREALNGVLKETLRLFPKESA